MSNINRKVATGVGMVAGAAFAALAVLGTAPAASADDFAVSDLVNALDPLTFNPAPDDLLGSTALGVDTILDDTYLNLLVGPVVDNVAGPGIPGLFDFW